MQELLIPTGQASIHTLDDTSPISGRPLRLLRLRRDLLQEERGQDPLSCGRLAARRPGPSGALHRCRPDILGEASRQR